MWGTWENMRDSRHAGLKVAAALAAFCLLATFILSVRAVVSADSLQNRIDRSFALESAQQRLLAGLAQGSAERLNETVDALLRQTEYGFRYLAVRDSRGMVLAAGGQYESLNRSATLSASQRRWLRAKLYTAFGESGQLSLRDGDRALGSLEYAIGSPAARLVRDEAVDRLRTTGLIGGVLALLFGGASLLLLRAALSRVSGQRRRLEHGTGSSSAVTTVTQPLSPAAALLSAFDSLHIGVIDIDAGLRVRLLNDTAAALTGWNLGDAKGQLVYTIFHARDDAGAPILSPAEHCVRNGGEPEPQELRLRPRGGSGHDAMVEARAVPLADGGARMVFQDVSGRIAQREALQAQARMAEGVVDHLLEAVLTTDTTGVVKSANARALRLFGYTLEEMQRMTVARLLPVPFMNTPGLKLADYTPGGAARMPKIAGWRKDATTFPAELVVEPMRVGAESRLVVILRDISEQMRSQSLAQRLGRLLDAASEEVYIFGAQSLYFTELNKGARKNLGLKPEQLARMNLANIAIDLEPAMLQSYLAKLRSGDAEHISYRANHRRSDGSTYPVEVRLSFSRDEEPPVFMAIALDITEREAAEKRLRQLAHFDALTNLPNRTLLFDRLNQAMHATSRGGRQLAVLFMDLDGFKPINDAHGHEAGDSVLQVVAERLSAGLRAADTVARFGGDEFVVLALGIRALDEARALAGKVHELFKAPFDIRGEKVAISTSIGITLFPADPADAEGLLRHADAAMYEAKQKGSGQTAWFTLPAPVAAGTGSVQSRPARAELARELLAGLRSQQLQLQLLPVLSGDGEVAAAMADFCWMHPEFGRVDAHETLQAARVAGLNAEIDHWLLREAANPHRHGQSQALSNLPVLVPLTAQQWRDPEFAERLQHITEAVSAPLNLLVLIIEGAEWFDAAGHVERLWPRLIQQGLRLAVRNPRPESSMDAVSMLMFTLASESGSDESRISAELQRHQHRRQPLLIGGLTSNAQWQRLRQAGARHGMGAGVQAALTPIEFASWVAARAVQPL